MKYLLDTHALVWAIADSNKLSAKVKNILESNQVDIYASAINFWEISLKYSLGKISLSNSSPEQLPELIKKMGFKILLPEIKEYASYHQLALADHRDPFDRMIIWQAIQQDMTLLTKDQNMKAYRSEGLKILW